MIKKIQPKQDVRSLFLKLKKWLLIAIVSLVVALSLGGTAIALSMFVKNLAGLGQMQFTDQCVVSEIEADDLTKVKVKLLPNANTMAGTTYTVSLFLNSQYEDDKTTSWTQAEIDAHAKKTLTFTGLDLVSVITFKVEITH